MTKTRSFKRLAAMLMCVAMMFSVLAISASALDSGDEYEPVLTSDAPHSMDIFASDAEVDPDDTITIDLQSMSYMGFTGEVTGASSNTTGYTATVSNDQLIVTCPSGTDYDDFSVSITFVVELIFGIHIDADGTLTLDEI